MSVLWGNHSTLMRPAACMRVEVSVQQEKLPNNQTTKHRINLKVVLNFIIVILVVPV
jgi:hypothetical protein